MLFADPGCGSSCQCRDAPFQLCPFITDFPLISCFTISKVGGDITICQIRGMFSRSLWSIKGYIHATSSGRALHRRLVGHS